MSRVPPHAEPELPPPSAELVLIRVQTEALMAVLGPAKSRKLLRLMAEKLAWQETLSNVRVFRPVDEMAKVRTARRQAAAIFERLEPSLVAALPPE